MQTVITTRSTKEAVVSDPSSVLSVAQRLIHILDHLGLPKAHFGLRYPLDLVGLLERAPERVASVICQGATGRPEPFAPVAAHTLWVLGDAGPSGQMQTRLEALPQAVVHWLTDYPQFPWSDTAVHHTAELARTMLQFLQRMDAAAALPTVHGSKQGAVAGVTYHAGGSGTPLVLLPLGLSSQQWEPVLPHLQAHYYTVVLGGPALQPVARLESRAAGGYSRMALQLLDLATPHHRDALIEVGCGTGALRRRFVRHTGMARVTGLDLNGFLLKEARALAVQEGLAERLVCVQGSAEALPFADHAFDIVYACTVMEEVDADRMLAEMVRIAKPGGRIAVGVRAVDRGPWTNVPLPAALKAKLEAPRGVADSGGMSAQGCADDSLYRRFQAAGLQAIEGGPAWAWNQLRPDNAWWQQGVEPQLRGILTPAEDQIWVRALQQAQVDGLPVWHAGPFHCAGGHQAVVTQQPEQGGCVGGTQRESGGTKRPTASHPSSDICRIRVHGKHNMHASPVQTPVQLA
jgi:SAM-dependent methyltransferase